MSSENILNDKIGRVSDILEQINELNKMIAIHKNDAENNSMLTPYMHMKAEFVNELNSILTAFRLDVKAA